MPARRISEVASPLTRIDAGSVLFCPTGFSRIGYVGSPHRSPVVEFDRVAHGILETRMGEQWSYKRAERHREWKVLEIGSRVDRYPPARYTRVYRGAVPPWPIPKHLFRAETLFDLRLSDRHQHQFARFAWRWWAVVRADLRKLFLWRSERGEDRWVVLERDAWDSVVETSQSRPIAFNPLKKGLLFVFQERGWQPFWAGADGYRLLFDPQNRLYPAGHPSRWMAVTRDREGWRALHPSPEPLPDQIEPIAFEERPWSEIACVRTTYPGRRHSIRLANGRGLEILIPDSHWAAPSAARVADLYSRIPRELLGVPIREIRVHSRASERGYYGQFDEGVIYLYPPAFQRELFATLLHEEIGHGGHPAGKAFLALWVSAMLADGTVLYEEAESVGEDHAQTVEKYFLGGGRRQFSHRLFVLDWLVRNSRTPWRERDVRYLLSLFRAEGAHLRFRPA